MCFENYKKKLRRVELNNFVTYREAVVTVSRIFYQYFLQAESNAIEVYQNFFTLDIKVMSRLVEI